MKWNGREWPCFRANLHARSCLSGGIFTPETTRELYADDGAFALTDLGNTRPLAPLPRMTTIPAVEWKVPGPRGTFVHLLALGVSENMKKNPASAEEAFAAAKAENALVYVAHPHKSGLRPAELLKMGSFHGIEIYNADARKIGKEYALNTWDVLLDGGMTECAGIAADGFLHPDSFRCGWVMICARDNSVPALLDGLRNRRFYATQGPRFFAIEFRDRRFHAEFTGAAEALLIGNTPHIPERNNSIPVRCEGFPWSGTSPADSPLECGPDFSDPVNVIDADLSGWSGFVRCQIRDRQGNFAWSQAFEL